MSSIHYAWPDYVRREWDSINLETEPRLFWEDRLAFAMRQEAGDRLEIASPVYAEISASFDAPMDIRRRAEERLETLQGRGNSPHRLETTLRHFVAASTDPVALTSMFAAGAVFRMTRLACLSRFAAAEASPWTRGALSRAIAATGAFALEAPAFTLTSRLGNAALDRRQDWTLRAIRNEFASGFLTLGSLRLGVWGSHNLHRSLAGISPQALSYRLSLQAGMFSGLLLGHGLETWAGWREPQSATNLFFDSLATLLQFNLAGHLMNRTYGRLGFWERSLELRSEMLGEHRPLFTINVGETNLSSPLPAGESTGTRNAIIESSEALSPTPLNLNMQASGRAKAGMVGGAQPRRRISAPTYARPPESPTIEDLPQTLSEWGDRFMEVNRSYTSAIAPELLRVDEKIRRHESLEPRDHRRLRGFLRVINSQLEAFHHDWLALRVNARASIPSGQEHSGLRERLRITLHDLQYRTQPLVMSKLTLETLLAGNLIRSYQRAYFVLPGSGNTASGAFKEGIARASVDIPEILQWVGSNWHQTGWDTLRFAEGHYPTKMVGDIIANLLSNAARYRSSDIPSIRMEVETIANGALRITVADDGIGILPEHRALLGQGGFQEGRKQIARSQGWGLSSVIQNLRSLSWGPLWVRSRPGEGSEFRFEIPADAFHRSNPATQDGPIGPGIESSLEENLRNGFFVPVSALDLAIPVLLKELPPSRISINQSASPAHLRTDSNSEIESGNRRLVALHRLLALGRNPAELNVIENGPA